jgi:hypothetical protein
MRRSLTLTSSLNEASVNYLAGRSLVLYCLTFLVAFVPDSVAFSLGIYPPCIQLLVFRIHIRRPRPTAGNRETPD